MTTELIDRKFELERLREAIANPPQLVVLRGRRRVTGTSGSGIASH